MAEYKYDTHTHTSQGSACGHITGAQLARLYAQNGYAGFIVTDHFFNGNCAVPKNRPWAQRVDLFYKGFEQARQEGERLGLSVFFGWEYNERGTELLTYGLGKDFLLSHPETETMPLEDYCDLVHEGGGFISHAHPFRQAPYIPAVRLFPDKVDAAEVINACHTNPEYNRKAMEYAIKQDLLRTAGSDTHFTQDFPGGGMAFDDKVDNIQDFIRAVRLGGARLLGGD